MSCPTVHAESFQCHNLSCDVTGQGTRYKTFRATPRTVIGVPSSVTVQSAKGAASLQGGPDVYVSLVSRHANIIGETKPCQAGIRWMFIRSPFQNVLPSW